MNFPSHSAPGQPAQRVDSDCKGEIDPAARQLLTAKQTGAPLALAEPMRALWLSSFALVSACVGGSEPPGVDSHFVAPTPSPLAAEGIGSVDPVDPVGVAEAIVAAPPLVLDPRNPEAPCATIEIATLPPNTQRMSQVDSISIDVSLGRGCHAEVVSLELFTPGGSTFEVRTRALYGGKRAHFTFPVAGTAIEQRGLAGAWQVRSFVDGKGAALSGFELTR